MPEAVNGTNPTVAPGNAPANFEQMLAEALRNGSATACEIGIFYPNPFFYFPSRGPNSKISFPTENTIILS